MARKKKHTPTRGSTSRPRKRSRKPRRAAHSAALARQQPEAEMLPRPGADETAQRMRETNQGQRRSIEAAAPNFSAEAPTSSQPSQAPKHDPLGVYDEMIRRLASLEETIAALSI